MSLRPSPVESVLALCPEEVDVVLEPQFEDEVLLDGVLGIWLLDLVSQEWQGGERKVVLKKICSRHLFEILISHS